MGPVSPRHTLRRGVMGLICSAHAFRRDAFITGSSPQPGKEEKKKKKTNTKPQTQTNTDSERLGKGVGGQLHPPWVVRTMQPEFSHRGRAGVFIPKYMCVMLLPS